ncbi:MAG: SDR family NAD(P)-dependent oxidoreductase [Prevotella sp.]
MSMYNPYSLEGKTILITGASSGIGRSTAIECSKLGARVVLVARNVERMNETLSHMTGEGHMALSGDLTLEEDVKRIVTDCPELDGVVNNAGISTAKPVAFYNEKDLNSIFGTNTFAPMLFNKWLLKKKKINKGASLVYTSSIASKSSHLGNGIYGSSKAALSAYMRYCARELAAKGIRCNAVLPGMVETKLIHDGAVSEEDLKKDLENYPLGRYGKPEDIAWAIIYLLSDASAWVTGHELVIDGGVTL